MNGVIVRGTGRCLPANEVTNADISQIVDTNDAWITSRTGIRARRHCTTETHTDLCIGAARQALAHAGITPQDVGVCIVATISSDWITPSAACLLQQSLGLPEDTVCFDLNAACSGFLYGLHTAECLLNAAPRKYGLVIGCETLSRYINWEDRSTCVLFGDGAGAVVVESTPSAPSIGAVLGARGNEHILQVPGAEKGRPSKIAMEGTSVFKFAVEIVPFCLDQVLEQTGMSISDIDFFVFHQANERIIDHVAKKYHIPSEKYAKNIASYGNTSAASIPILLSELVDAGNIHSGNRVLCVGFGGGLTWGGAVIQIA